MASYIGGSLYRRPNFTQEDLRTIRKKYADGQSTRKLAAEYNCSNATIYNIALNKTHASHTTKASLAETLKDIAKSYDIDFIPVETLARTHDLPEAVIRAILDTESARFAEAAATDPRKNIPEEFHDEWSAINAEALDLAEATRKLRDKQIDFRRRVTRFKLAEQAQP